MQDYNLTEPTTEEPEQPSVHELGTILGWAFPESTTIDEFENYRVFKPEMTISEIVDDILKKNER